MKNIRLLYLLLFITFVSCNKSNDDEPKGDYYVTFKLNGTSVSHNGPNYCWLKKHNNEPSRQDFQLSSTSADFKHFLGLTVWRYGPIGTGVTYKNSPGNYPVIADYFQDQAQPNEIIYANGNAPGMPDNDFSVTFTKITDKYIMGTFTGNYLYDYGGDQTITITEGKFYVKRNP
jgi:hypothetical protein